MKKFVKIAALLCAATLAFVACSSGDDNNLAALAATLNSSAPADNDIVSLRTIVVGTDYNDDEKSAIRKRFPNCVFASSSSDVNSSYKVIICDATSGRIPEGSTANDANIILYELENGDWTAWKDVITSKTSALGEAGEADLFEAQIGKFPYHFFGINRAIDSELFVRYVEKKDKWSDFYATLHGGSSISIAPDYSSATGDYASVHEYTAGTRADQEEDEEEGAYDESEISRHANEQSLVGLFRHAARWVLNNQTRIEAQKAVSSNVAQNIASMIQKSEGNAETYDLSRICGEYSDNIGMSYNIGHRLRKLPLSKEDRIDGHGGWSIQLAYKPFLVTGSASNGLYYAVKANISVSNKDAYKGRWWNRHGGTYVRLTGYYLDNFIATFKPTAKIGDTEYDVQFPVGCEPTPKTQSNDVHYTTGFEWGLDGTLEGGYSQEKGGSAGAKLGGHFKYSDSKSYDIHDVNIYNNRDFEQSGGKKKYYVSYKLQLKNLPDYEWSQYRGFTEGCDACKSTVEFNTSWLWYIPGDFTKDNMPTLSVQICGQPFYGAMSFITTKADLEKRSFDDGLHTETKVFRQPK